MKQNTEFFPDSFYASLPEKHVREGFTQQLEDLIEATYPDLNKSYLAIEAAGLPVVFVEYQFHLRAMMILAKADPGFIPPTLQHYNDLVDTLLKYYPEKANLDFSKGLLLVTGKNNHLVTLVHDVFHWQAFCNGLEGYSERSYRLYRVFVKKYKGELTPKFIDSLTLEDLNALRAAIFRYEESLGFLQTIIDKILIPKNNSALLSKGEAQA